MRGDTVQGNDVVALDATSGRIFWIYRYTPSPAAKYFGVNRGVAILGNTIFIATGDNHVIAIDAKNPCGSFGWAIESHLGRAENTSMRRCSEFGGRECVVRAWACDEKG